MAIGRGAAILVVVLLGGAPCFGQEASSKEHAAADSRAKIEGVWRGNSVCEDKKSACHDEVNVYRFAAITGKANAFTVTASKVVGGKEIVMGSGEWKYDEEAKAVTCEKPAIRMVIDGKKMEGALKLDNGTVYRRIFLIKETCRLGDSVLAPRKVPQAYLYVAEKQGG
jgi:hypothetical protein